MTRQQHGEQTPECALGECGLCPGPGAIRRPGAPAWEAPVQTIRCTCSCHHPQPPAEAKRCATAGKWRSYTP